MSLPTGTVTFVFTDIEGSTRLLKQLGDEEYATLLAVHRRLVREIFAAHDGREIDTQGDAFFYTFVRARQAVAAAVEVQRAHAKATWPSGLEVRVRLGLHTGEPAVGDEGYTGLDVVRASRIAATGAGGQILISDTTRAIVAGGLPEDVSVHPLGDRQLKDIDRPEPLFELRIEDLEPAGVGERSSADAGADGGGTHAEDRPAASDGDGSGDHPSSPLRAIIDQARQRIEARVLAELGNSLGSDFAFGPGERTGRSDSRRPSLPAESVPQAPSDPPDPPARSVADEIGRLDQLRRDGALTDEQYARAVDRLLDRDAPRA